MTEALEKAGHPGPQGNVGARAEVKRVRGATAEVVAAGAAAHGDGP